MPNPQKRLGLCQEYRELVWRYTRIGSPAVVALLLGYAGVDHGDAPFWDSHIAVAMEAARFALHRHLSPALVIKVLSFTGLQNHARPSNLEALAHRIGCREYTEAVTAANRADMRGREREAYAEALCETWDSVSEQATPHFRTMVLEQVVAYADLEPRFQTAEAPGLMTPASPQVVALMWFHHLYHGRPRSSSMTEAPSEKARYFPRNQYTFQIPLSPARGDAKRKGGRGSRTPGKRKKLQQEQGSQASSARAGQKKSKAANARPPSAQQEQAVQLSPVSTGQRKNKRTGGKVVSGQRRVRGRKQASAGAQPQRSISSMFSPAK